MTRGCAEYAVGGGIARYHAASSTAPRPYTAPGSDDLPEEESPDPLTADRGSSNLEHETGFEPATLTLAT